MLQPCVPTASREGKNPHLAATMHSPASPKPIWLRGQQSHKNPAAQINVQLSPDDRHARRAYEKADGRSKGHT